MKIAISQQNCDHFLMDISYLNKQIDSIMKDNASSVTNSKSTRDIIYFRNSLKENDMNFEFHMNVAEIEPDFADFSLGKSQFKRSEYQLSWMARENDGFRFVLTNIPYKNSKYLLDCPEDMQKDIIRILPKFVDEIAIEAKKTLKDSSYQQ